MARRNAAPRDTKGKILDAALAVFEERGFHAASIDEVAARAGLTKGAVYYWFTDKDDLARDLHEQIWQRLKAEALAGVDPSDSTLDVLERGLDAYLTALERLGSARFFLRDALAIPAVETASRQEKESSLGLVRDVLEEGIRRGEIVPLDVSAMARALVGAYSEATLHILATGEVEPTRAVISHLVRSLTVAPVSPSRRKAVRS